MKSLVAAFAAFLLLACPRAGIAAPGTVFRDAIMGFRIAKTLL